MKRTVNEIINEVTDRKFINAITVDCEGTVETYNRDQFNSLRWQFGNEMAVGGMSNTREYFITIQ